jgi:hypothetical protein
LQIKFQAALLQYWPWSPVLCKLAPFASTLNINVSVLTLAAISLDRFKVIFYPLKPKLRFKHFICIISVIWIVSILISSFNLFTYEKRFPSSWLANTSRLDDTPYDPSEFVCDVVNLTLFKYFLAIEVFIQFVLPLAIITFSVLAIYYKIYLQKREYADTLNQSTRRIKNRKKVTFANDEL